MSLPDELRTNRFTYGLLALIFLIGLALRLLWIGEVSLDFDEVWHAELWPHCLD